MTARRMDAFAELISTRALIARRHEDTWKLPPATLPLRSAASSVPVDIYEDVHEFRVVAELPGIDSASLEVTVAGNVLSIRGRVPSLSGPPPRTYSHRSACCGPVAREVALPKPVNGDETTAVIRDGTLVVTLPKAVGAGAAHIPVNPSSG